NPHEGCPSGDFKSPASAYSATRPSYTGQRVISNGIRERRGTEGKPRNAEKPRFRVEVWSKLGQRGSTLLPIMTADFLSKLLARFRHRLAQLRCVFLHRFQPAGPLCVFVFKRPFLRVVNSSD